MGSTIASHAIIQRAGVGGGGPSKKPGDLNKELLTGSIGQRVEDNLNRLLRRTHTLIERERDTIMRLAHALEEHKTLAGEDVIAVIELKQGTRVDGSQYADPEFIAQIEDYHTRMLAAHQQGVQRIEFDPPMRTALVSMALDDESWYVVRNTPGVTAFVGNASRPTPLSRKEVESILGVGKEEPGQERKVRPRLEFEVGEQVRVVAGPFADFNGAISDIDVARSKLTVLVNIFGRETPVELELGQVAKL